MCFCKFQTSPNCWPHTPQENPVSPGMLNKWKLCVLVCCYVFVYLCVFFANFQQFNHVCKPSYNCQFKSTHISKPCNYNYNCNHSKKQILPEGKKIAQRERHVILVEAKEGTALDCWWLSLLTVVTAGMPLTLLLLQVWWWWGGVSGTPCRDLINSGTNQFSGWAKYWARDSDHEKSHHQVKSHYGELWHKSLTSGNATKFDGEKGEQFFLVSYRQSSMYRIWLTNFGLCITQSGSIWRWKVKASNV